MAAHSSSQQPAGIPQFNHPLSLALDKLIVAIEVSRPTARKPLRIIKRCLEAGIPAGPVQQ